MIEENLRLLEKLYQQYNDPVKPLLAEIEAIYEKFPLPLYNEIRAMNDHVARAVTAEDDEKAVVQLEKAKSHINRITRDCYKFLDVYYKREAEKFDRFICTIEPSTTEEFQRMADYGKLSDIATNLVEYAKKNEHLVSDEETYINFEKAYNAYKELHNFIVMNRRVVFSIKRKKQLKRLASVILSIFTFLLGCIITNNNQRIVDVFMQLFRR